jgi:hypothetical protein
MCLFSVFAGRNPYYFMKLPAEMLCIIITAHICNFRNALLSLYIPPGMWYCMDKFTTTERKGRCYEDYSG